MSFQAPTWKPKPTPSLKERLALRPKELAEQLGVSVASLNRQMKLGKIRSTKLGRSVLIPIDEVQRLLGMEKEHG